MEDILSRLNSDQLKAVKSDPNRPLLILAAAGVGKTQVLTSRITYLIKECGADPSSILAVTFTKKAADEMRERAQALSGVPEGGLNIGTFHGICARILRRYADRLGFSTRYRILDADDSAKVMGRIGKGMGVDKYHLDEMRWQIEKWRNAGWNPDQVSADDKKDTRFTLRFYKSYRNVCKSMDAIDFNDLLLHTVRLLGDNPDVLRDLRAQWHYLLVDEFQDTNSVQYEFVKLLSHTHHKLTVVGDDYQAIHEWRGASVRNILEFEHDFPLTNTVFLEKNYRSRSNILEAATHVIGNNKRQRSKRLVPTKGEGQPIHVMAFETEVDEAEWIASYIKRACVGGKKPSQFAVLYRMNSQSQSVEKALIRQNVPYKLHGGVGFYDRKEVKDVLSYMRLAYNTRSDIDFERILNVPTRGIGEAGMAKIQAHAKEMGVSFYEAAENLLTIDKKKSKARSNLKVFIEDIKAISDEIACMKPSDACKLCLEKSGYIQWLREKEDEGYIERIENIDRLVASMVHFEATATASAPDALVTLQDFLDELSLYSHVCISNDDDPLSVDAVTLMTLHSSKGLEFDCVFVCGMAENIFPHYMALKDGKVEEERRLCYVGITRAKEQLFLCYPKKRMNTYIRPNMLASDSLEKSRFIREIPDRLLVAEPQQKQQQRAPSSSC
jgi:DNA helicase II / ATP-dependent DNA helicase PcrA